MKRNKWSVNAKLNGVLCEIEQDLRGMCETEAESMEEVRRYVRDFPREIDFNLAQYGCLLVYHDQVKEFYKKHGYKTLEKVSDSKRWELYKRQVGYVARRITM